MILRRAAIVAGLILWCVVTLPLWLRTVEAAMTP